MNILAHTGDIFHGRGKLHASLKEQQVWDDLRRPGHDVPQLPRPQGYTASQPIYKRLPVVCRGLTWSFDGSSLVAVHEDCGIRQYAVCEEQGPVMAPVQRFFKPQAIISHAVHPQNSLFQADSSLNVVVVSCKDMPYQLYPLHSNPDQPARALQTYNSASESTEEFRAAYAMDFLDDAHFLAGSTRNTVSLFDASRRESIWVSSATRRGCGRGQHKAIVSCFDEANERRDCVRYAGTYRSELLRIDPRTSSISSWKAIQDKSRGIYQVLQSNNGHYFYIMKRYSNSITVLDSRKSMAIVNQFKLPFQTHAQKLRGTYSTRHGLLIGDEAGRILQWAPEVVEFGGIDRSGSVPSYGIGETGITHVCAEGSRINIIEKNPADSDIFAISYSPDKYGEDVSCNAGILLMRL
ncbi:ABL147Wp [Eremothecium gossypii ATCC 10895]|uniref:Protein SWT21 n=1 Tax=Eremothecium gossypii (strain ATCC 10895 / CBS 109.51 / FGSC 9923 / NRRL Y-1056) TaxID=284811 RepID=SWT21_EREGS|nr:ABL147Wp [Eremothecium gossypii ATCC 10895]Q75E79.1 RecName: Full=Protein SWT21 [Eremothecium gossypii ATCC 10895]AAS50624.1 ABL147Wp [Eremothecium gossypii ATCC 10895]AEY94912.1 FABL147Wp [Eremothecium gossypii FDAG1]